jgi:LmbE family N-acetylglucosaminyl deacetylase
VYITAGDAGSGQSYWLSREQGSEAAYSSMMGTHDSWVTRSVKLASKQYVSVANPSSNSKVSLIFMHLPDGDIRGTGFAASHHESLARLRGGRIDAVHTVDGQSVYDSEGLIKALTSLMHVYRPSVVRSQSALSGSIFPDHSDHMTVGYYARRAYELYELEQYNNEVTVPFHSYTGYPVHELPANVSGDELRQKRVAFLAYARYDNGVCQSEEQCSNTPTYGSYLSRQYQASY